MPGYTENHVLVRFGGPAWSGQESWTNGFRLRHNGGDAVGPMNDDILATIEDVATIVRNYFLSSAADYSAGVQLGWLDMNVINKDTGKYQYPNSPNVWEYPEPLSSGPAGAGYPQIAYCVTLRGVNKRGPAARGRWYVPCGTDAAPVTSTGVMPATDAQTRADRAADMLVSVREIEAGEGPTVWNPYLFGDGDGGPQQSPLTAVQVGNVYDTQRRRRRQIAETYYAAETWT